MRGRLSRISKSDNSGKTRTEEIEGEFGLPPMVGRPFSMFGMPIDTTKDFRLWKTSPVQEVMTDCWICGWWAFKTESGSEYVLKTGDECECG